MGLLTDIGQLFGTDATMARKATALAWLQKLERDEADKRASAQRLLDWYNKDRAAILVHLEQAAKKTFSPGELTEWQWALVNGVQRTIRRLSLSYKEPPERVLIDLQSRDPLPDDDPAYEIYARMLRDLDIDKKMKEVDRMATLFNTLHVECVLRDGAVDWDLHLRNESFVVPDPTNEWKPLRHAHQWTPFDPDTLIPEPGWVLWTPEQYVFITDGGKEFGMINDDGSNPYGGLMPITVVRKLEQDDYWGIFGADLVDGFEQCAIQISNMWENLFMQTHGQPFGTNLGLPEGATLRTGPKNPILVDGVSKDKHPPSLTFPKPEADIKEVFDTIDWFIKELGSTYGLPPSAWSHEQDDLSGFAKLVDNLELLENREEEIPMWKRVEEDLFWRSVMVWNRWARQIEGAQPMPENVGIRVSFPDVTFPESPTEESTRIAMDIKNGLTTAAHEIARRKRIPLADAIDEAKEIARINREIKGSLSISFPQETTGSAQVVSQGEDQNANQQEEETINE